MSELIPLDRVIYVIRPCLIGNWVVCENAIDDVFYCDCAEVAERQEERGNAFRFSRVGEYLDYARELAVNEGVYNVAVEQFLNRFLNAPWRVRSPEWEEKLKLFQPEEVGDGIWWPDRIYLHANPIKELPAV